MGGKRTVFMTGGSRGIGLAIAQRLAADGTNVAFMAKTDTPDPRLPGTVHTAAAAIEEAGGCRSWGTSATMRRSPQPSHVRRTSSAASTSS
jgi:NAD(P)-dependent dehydrogenase (short-subunit alcohol dehydrogenase family)